jgi:predicted Zn-dependent protease
MSRIAAAGGAIGNATEIKKMLGEPIPELADPKTIPRHIAEMFEPGGMLERLRKKLARSSRKRGRKILPAKNTIASVDENDNVYVGVEFLEKYGDDEALVAAILAHEWGHMMSDLPRGIDWSHLTWEQLHAIRRDEEADADGFAGRALYLMGFKPDAMVNFLKKIDKKRDKRVPCHKYHNTATRVEILKQSYEAEEKAMEVARRLFFGSKVGAKVGRVLSEG